MANYALYYMVEIVQLSNPQRNNLYDALSLLGEANASQFPNQRLQMRQRLDGDARIYEALFDEVDLTPDGFKAFIASAINAPIGNITGSPVDNAYGYTVSYLHSIVERVRFTVFGGSSGVLPSTWSSSRAAADSYLIANSASWQV